MANEKQLIDDNELIDRLTKYTGFRGNCEDCTDIDCVDCIIENAIKNAPTVDAVEVKHGRWQPHYEIFDADPAVGILGGNYQTGWQCSVCGRYESIQEPYCNCGAKMDGDADG